MSVDSYHNDTATFGDRLTLARTNAGLGRDDLARKLGVTPGTLRDWEEDASAPRANRLHMLSSVLGVSILWLLDGTGPATPGGGAVNTPDMLGAVLTELRATRASVERAARRLDALELKLDDVFEGNQP